MHLRLVPVDESNVGDDIYGLDDTLYRLIMCARRIRFIPVRLLILTLLYWVVVVALPLKAFELVASSRISSSGGRYIAPILAALGRCRSIACYYSQINPSVPRPALKVSIRWIEPFLTMQQLRLRHS